MSSPSSLTFVDVSIHDLLPTFYILRVLITMKFSASILTIFGVAAYVSAQSPNATTKTAELLEGLQKAPTRLARLNVLKDNTDVSTPYRLLWSLEPNASA